MKKTIIVSIVSLSFGAVATLMVFALIDLYKLRTMVVADNKTLSDVVLFLNTTIEKSKVTNNTQMIAQPINPISVPVSTTTKK